MREERLLRQVHKPSIMSSNDRHTFQQLQQRCLPTMPSTKHNNVLQRQRHLQLLIQLGPLCKAPRPFLYGSRPANDTQSPTTSPFASRWDYGLSRLQVFPFVDLLSEVTCEVTPQGGSVTVSIMRRIHGMLELFLKTTPHPKPSR